MSESNVSNEGLFGVFPEDVRKDVEGLTLLGYLEHQIDFCGHVFVLRTLYADEELNVGLVAKEFSGALTEAKAFAYATVACALLSVDYDEDFCPPIGPDKRAFARARFAYCTSKWFPPLLDFLFVEYKKLIERRDKAIEAMQSKSQTGRTTSSLSPDSSTAPVASEILDLVED